MKENTLIEIDLRKIVAAVLLRWWVVVLAAAVGTAGAYCVTKYQMTPMYSATAKMYVNNAVEKASTTITTSDISASKSLVQTYIAIIRSDTVLYDVIDKIGSWFTPAQISGMLTAGAINSTEMFYLTITHPNPDVAATIANAIAEAAPSHIFDIVEGSSAKIVEYAKAPHSPSSPDVRSNTMTGGLGGLLLAVIVLALIAIFDTRVNSEADLAYISELPLLGVISDFKTANTTKYGYSSTSTPEKAAG
ncbi:MAG: hypothetical protein LBH28_11360 [Oscillospiraceae bacterium]|nr:hypothetical protein [Oscillospiraceae bacterium]